MPAARFAVANCAEPAASAPDPICVCPSRNDTFPVGVPAPDCGVTRAVNVTLAPALICVAEAEREVVVLIFAGAETVIEIADDTDAAKFVSPEYVTVTECEPAASVLVLYEAAPATSAGMASCVGPSRTVTVPVGVPVPEFRATEIFKVSICPVVSCVADAETDVVVAIFADAETVTSTAGEVDPEKFGSPEYAAVMLCDPFASVDVVKVAESALTTPLPI